MRIDRLNARIWECFLSRMTQELNKSNLIRWLEEFCRERVSISSTSNCFLYTHCKNKNIRDDFRTVSHCFYKGFSVKIIIWKPKFNEAMARKHHAPTWILFKSLPTKLIHIQILKRLGNEFGELVGIKTSYNNSSDVKLLINSKIGKLDSNHLKIIANRSIYNLTYIRYEGNIKEIIKIDPIITIHFKFMKRNRNLKETL